MKLPNPDNAYINDNKLAGYSLNFSHAEGQHKARVFKAALDLTLESLEDLRNALLEAVKTYDAMADKSNQYGQNYVIDFPMTYNNKTAIIHSVWIIRYSETFPRLVTCYIL
ncbi:MAG: DUF6883 domain-containing protein [Crocosphaera sp.]|jgi:hypothetical protein